MLFQEEILGNLRYAIMKSMVHAILHVWTGTSLLEGNECLESGTGRQAHLKSHVSLRKDVWKSADDGRHRCHPPSIQAQLCHHDHHPHQ